jgi:hypothetical protein
MKRFLKCWNKFLQTKRTRRTGRRQGVDGADKNDCHVTIERETVVWVCNRCVNYNNFSSTSSRNVNGGDPSIGDIDKPSTSGSGQNSSSDVNTHDRGRNIFHLQIMDEIFAQTPHQRTRPTLRRVWMKLPSRGHQLMFIHYPQRWEKIYFFVSKLLWESRLTEISIVPGNLSAYTSLF